MGAYLPRSQRSANLPLLEQPAVPAGLLGGIAQSEGGQRRRRVRRRRRRRRLLRRLV
jgi:hypothetical protein